MALLVFALPRVGVRFPFSGRLQANVLVSRAVRLGGDRPRVITRARADAHGLDGTGITAAGVGAAASIARLAAIVKIQADKIDALEKAAIDRALKLRKITDRIALSGDDVSSADALALALAALS